MTLHINLKDIKCEKCSAVFIPFRQDFKCPKCNEPTNEFFDFIPELIGSMKYHKERYGKFTPDAWYIGSLAEDVQSIIFKIFDVLEIDKPINPEEFIITTIDKINWRDQQYLKNHIKEIALEVLKIYLTQKDSWQKRDDVIKVSGWKRRLKIFMP